MLRKVFKALGGLIALAGVVVGALQIPQIHDQVWQPKTHEVERVVGSLKLSLEESHTVHDDLVAILSDVNFCRRWPHDEARNVLDIAARRDLGGKRLATVKQTDDSQAKELIDAYGRVLDTSRATDVAYAAWLSSWDRRFKQFQSAMQPGQKCPIDRRGALYARYLEDNKTASDAKLWFLSLYKQPAEKYHATMWGSKQI
jgi:hypothetical protein